MRRLAGLGDDAPSPWYSLSAGSPLIGTIRCDACNSNIPSAVWNQHITKDKHIRRTKIAGFQSVLRETEKDRHGIEVSHGANDETGDTAVGVDFGTIDPSSLEEVKKIVTLRLSTPASVALTSARLASAAGQSSRAPSQ